MNHDHIDKLKEVTDPQRVAIALGLRRQREGHMKQGFVQVIRGNCHTTGGNLS